MEFDEDLPPVPRCRANIKREKRRDAATDRKRRQRERTKNDPEMYAAIKLAERDRSRKRRAEGTLKRIKDMTCDEIAFRRTHWRQYMKRYREKQQILVKTNSSFVDKTRQLELKSLANSRIVMDESAQILVKNESSPEVDDTRTGELIIPDLVPSEDPNSHNEGLDLEIAIKAEPMETEGFVDDGNDIENPYQCFECGLDCQSQGELIDHYETSHSHGSSRKSEYNGNSSPEEGNNEDPLSGDVAPDSSDEAADVEGAQNYAAPHEVLLLYTCPCCGHSSTDWNQLVKHIQEHVQVTCLSCLDCMHIFSSSYRLKDHSDKAHSCYHCPFKTQSYQNLKDHCFLHHKNTALMSGSYQNNHSASNPVAFEMATSQLQNPVGQLPVPYNGIQPGCYFVLGNTFPRAQHVNGAIPVSNIMPAQVSPNIIPQLVQQHTGNAIPLASIHKGAAKRIDPLYVRPTVKNKKKSSSLGKQESPVESSPPFPPRVPKTANRTLPPKVPVSELLEKWSFPKVPLYIAPKTKPSVVPSPSSNTQPLPDAPPCTTTKGCDKTRRGIKTKPCPYCSHLARDSHSLKTHILTHTKEKPFACELCNYRATQRAHIQKHMLAHRNGIRRKFQQIGNSSTPR